MARRVQLTHPSQDARVVFTQKYKNLALAITEHQSRAGKAVQPYHFSNEIRLIKRLVNNGSHRISPEEMTPDQLYGASYLMTKDAELLQSDVDYSRRKAVLG